MRVTSEAARRFLVARHFLAPARALEEGPDSVLEVIRKLGSIQFDPIAVAGRNHDLMLHARVADYEPAWCDALYERREIFETTNKALSFIPAEEFPWYRVNAGRKGPRFHAAALKENAAVAEAGARAHPRGRAALLGRLRARERRARRTGSGCRRTPCARCSRRTRSRARSGSPGARATSATTTSSSGSSRPSCSRGRSPSASSCWHKQLSRHRAHGLLGAGGAGGTFARIADPGRAQVAARGARRARRARAGRDRGPARQAVRPRRRGRAARGAARAAALRRVHRAVRLAALGHEAARAACSGSTSSGRGSSSRRSAAGATTCSRSSSATGSSAGSSRGSTATAPRRGARPVVGGRIRADARRRIRRRDARRAPRLPPLRRRRPSRVGAPARRGEAIIRGMTSQSDRVDAFRTAARKRAAS